MSNSSDVLIRIDLLERVSVSPETRQELNYRTVIDTEKCTISGECFKVCEVNAIYDALKRMPTTRDCATVDSYRASQWWTRINVPGVGTVFPSARHMQLKWCPFSF